MLLSKEKSIVDARYYSALKELETSEARLSDEYL